MLYLCLFALFLQATGTLTGLRPAASPAPERGWLDWLDWLEGWFQGPAEAAGPAPGHSLGEAAVAEVAAAFGDQSGDGFSCRPVPDVCLGATRQVLIRSADVMQASKMAELQESLFRPVLEAMQENWPFYTPEDYDPKRRFEMGRVLLRANGTMETKELKDAMAAPDATVVPMVFTPEFMGNVGEWTRKTLGGIEAMVKADPSRVQDWKRSVLPVLNIESFALRNFVPGALQSAREYEEPCLRTSIRLPCAWRTSPRISAASSKSSSAGSSSLRRSPLGPGMQLASWQPSTRCLPSRLRILCRWASSTARATRVT